MATQLELVIKGKADVGALIVVADGDPVASWVTTRAPDYQASRRAA